MVLQFFGDISSEIPEKKRISSVSPTYVNESRIGSFDLRLANLECPIVNHDEKPILKTGPNLCISCAQTEILEKTSIGAVSLANNHVGDYGGKGIINTLAVLGTMNIQSIGAGENLRAAYKPLRISIGGIAVSVLAFCENEFGVAGEETAGVAGYDVSLIEKAVSEEKSISDYIVVLMHGGNEFNPLPSPGMQKRYRHLVDIGASVVVGTHTHCPQGYEKYKDGFIAYSLGNYYFPNSERQPEDHWNYGYVLEVIFENKYFDYSIVPHKYNYKRNELCFLTGDSERHFLHYLELVNTVLKDTKQLETYFNAWCLHQGKKYAERLYWKESMEDVQMRSRQTIEIQNLFRCEAHRELMQRYFELWSENEQNNYEDVWEKIMNFQRIYLG